MASHPAEAGGAPGGGRRGPLDGDYKRRQCLGTQASTSLFFLLFFRCPISPLGICSLSGGLSSRTVRELATTRVVEGILTSRRTGVEGQMVGGFAHNGGHYFYTLAWRDSAMFVPKRERRAWGLSQVRRCCNGDLVFKQQRMNTLTRDLAFLDLPNKVFGETQQ